MISVQQWRKWLSKGDAALPYILLENYKKLHLSDIEMMLIIHIHSYIREGLHFPSVDQLQARMSCSKLELGHMLNKLRKEKFIEIRSSYDDENKVRESYSLDPLWDKLFRYLTIGLEKVGTTKTEEVWPVQTSSHDQTLVASSGEIFKRFEEEFGRPLSPMECENITLWIDQDDMNAEMIFLALREAVISNKLSMRYIDRILFDWQKNGYRTVQEAYEHTQQFRDQQGKQQQVTQLKRKEPKQPVKFQFYNWLERKER